MRRMFSLTCFNLICCSAVFGQSNNYQSLLDVVTQKTELFVLSKPVVFMNLQLKDTNSRYLFNTMNFDTLKLDRKVLIQLIQNAQHLDTTVWKEDEFPSSILIEKPFERKIIFKEVWAKLKYHAKVSEEKIRREVRLYNKPPYFDMQLTRVSRPVFDSSGTYAICSFVKGNASASIGVGYGYWNLYKKVNDVWIDMQPIHWWNSYPGHE